MIRGLALAALSAAIAGPATGASLDEAVALALAHEPGLQRAQAEADAAQARLRQAQAGRLPSLTASGQAGTGHMDYGQFFGFGARDISPWAGRLILQQPLFAGGAITAAIDQAAAGQTVAQQQLVRARLDLQARVADVYGQVLVADDALRLNTRQVEASAELARQAELSFNSGAAPRTDLAQAKARAAEARAGLARAEADAAQARARYRALIDQDPDELAQFGPPPEIPATLDAALAIARDNSPALVVARAGASAADAGERRVHGGALPELGLVAELSSQRDQFLPGYRADGYTVGIQGRWTLFSGGLQSAKMAEARAQRRAANASLAEANAAVDEGVVSLWAAVQAADRIAEAAAQQVDSAQAAETSLGFEVKVSAKPTIDLLNAQRDTLAARMALSKARRARIVTRYQLLSILGSQRADVAAK